MPSSDIASRARLSGHGDGEEDLQSKPGVAALRTAPKPALPERYGNFRRTIRDAVLIFLGTRIACLSALVVSARLAHKSLSSVLTVFDGGWYHVIASHWYPSALPAGTHGLAAQSPLAFFPLYPLLAGALMRIGLPFATSAVLIDTIAGSVAAALIAVTVEGWTSRKVGLLTAAFWAAYPLAAVMSLAYAEALFTLFAAACLLALCRDRVVLAGICAALACLTRPTGVALVVVCVAVAARNRSVRSLLAGVIGLMGLFGWMLYLAFRTGHADAWLIIERRGWNVYFDFGLDHLHKAVHYLTHPAQKPAATAVALLMIGVIVLIVTLWWQPIPRRFWLYSVMLLIMAVGTHNAYSSAPRFMLPAFPMFMPLAAVVRRLPRIGQWALPLASTLVMAGAAVYLALYSVQAP